MMDDYRGWWCETPEVYYNDGNGTGCGTTYGYTNGDGTGDLLGGSGSGFDHVVWTDLTSGSRRVLAYAPTEYGYKGF